MFLVAGAEAGVMRSQLATADSDLISPGVFNQMFTMHATAMVFNVIMPLSASFFNLIVPLAIGARGTIKLKTEAVDGDNSRNTSQTFWLHRCVELDHHR